MVKSESEFLLSQQSTMQTEASDNEEEVDFDFDWDVYLAETKGVAAPPECFSQSIDPPTNSFEEDMKLEVPDPRCSTNTCVATVISNMGPRIRLRLDGSDTCNDFWVLCDSSDIKPLGTTESRGGFLLPPIGFKDDSSKWRKFLNSVLHDCYSAPKDCFATEKVRNASENRFEVGMKLEAVDRKNPFMISPATVTEATKQDVKITFDGWSSTFDCWMKYTSRDLFPAGWCTKNNHPLQPPPTWDEMGPNAPTPAPASKSADQESQPKAKKAPEPKPAKKSATLTPVDAETSRPASRVSNASSTGKSSSAAKPKGRPRKRAVPEVDLAPAQSPVADGGKAKPDLAISVKNDLDNTHFVIFVNAGCNAGPLLNGSVIAQLPSQMGPGSVNHLLREAVQSLINCDAFSVVIFVNAGCNAGPLLNGSVIAQLPSQMGPGSVNHLLREAVQSLINCDAFSVVIFVNAGCNAGPLLNGSVIAQLPSQMGPGSVNHLLREAVQSLINCDAFSVVIFVNAGCNAGPLLNGSVIAQLPSQMGPGSVNHLLREAVQSLINCDAFSVVIFVNAGCNAGPLLNGSVIAQLPSQMGPGSVNHLLREAVQSLINCDAFSVVIFVNAGCNAGPLLNGSVIAQLPSQMGPGSVNHLLREAVQSLINCDAFSVVIFVNAGCNAGPLLNGSVIAQLPSQMGPGSVNHLLREAVQSLIICDAFSVVIFVNAGCNAGPLLNGSVIAQLPSQMGPGSVNHLLREAVQSLINCAQDTKAVFTAVAPGNGHTVVTGDFNSQANVRHLPVVASAEMAWKFLKQLLMDLGSCSNLLHHSPFCAICDGRYISLEPKRFKTDEQGGSFVVDLTRRMETDPNGVGGDVNPLGWTVEEVATYIAGLEDPAIKELADEFRKQDVDGRALLLLTSDMIVKYIHAKLGPAVKLSQTIDQLRRSLAARRLI